MATIIDTTVEAHNSYDLAVAINAAFADKGDQKVVVNSREAKPVFHGRDVAKSWLNYTVSVDVVGRSKGKVGTVYAKVGGRIVVELV